MRSKVLLAKRNKGLGEVKKRVGGIKKRFRTFISFADEYVYKAALIKFAVSRRLTFSVICREMVALYIKENKIEVPESVEAAEQIVREFAEN